MADEIPWLAGGAEFGTAKPGDEFFHGTCGVSGTTLTETWFWGFQETQANLHGFIYVWVHPNLGSCTGGLWVQQGHKPHALASEFFDIQPNMSGDIFDKQNNIRLANGLNVVFHEPLRHMSVSYSSPENGFDLKLEYTAFTEVVMRANNKHFEQGMRAVGSVLVGGKRHQIDCLTVRDRSWGDLRPEAGFALPPYTYMNGSFSDQFVFQIGAHDDPEKSPEWAGLYDLPPDKILRDAWIYRDGLTKRLTRVSKRTERHPSTLAPLRHSIEAEDEDGQRYEIWGVVTASSPWNPWQNCQNHVGLTRWHCAQVDGIGWGETQEVQWNHYMSRFMK